MKQTLAKIEAFLAEHHLMTLATSRDDTPWACSLFYAYLPDTVHFVVASDPDTRHIRNVSENAAVAGTVALETTTVGKIRGVQFDGIMRKATEVEAKAYFKVFPYARAMRPVLWVVVPERMKLTDNRLGFGTKLTWIRDAASE